MFQSWFIQYLKANLAELGRRGVQGRCQKRDRAPDSGREAELVNAGKRESNGKYTISLSTQLNRPISRNGIT